MTDADGFSRAELIAIIVELRRTNGVLAERVEFLEAEVERLRSALAGGTSKVVPEWAVRTIKGHPKVMYGLDFGLGELRQILHAVSEVAKPEYAVLLEEIRGSPVVNADETGWREDGINGYIWSFSTPKLRYFV